MAETFNQIRINAGISYLRFRRYLELIFIIIMFPVILILFLLFSIMVFIDSGNRIIYKQTRIGLNGKPFIMYKFRTMRAIPKFQNNYFLHQRDRVTSFGKFLRKHRLDELPQIWNVLKGDMSLIGPRPEAIELYYYFLNAIPDYLNRTMITPGITGWAQANYAHTLTIEGNKEKLKYDIYYINHLSIKLDLIIIIKTLKVIFTGKNSE
ncbi:MAG: sugar transferase [Bacteroidetes bacterium]|nr:MAG: sugar transferase [Bacteroidota bacterium]